MGSFRPIRREERKEFAQRGNKYAVVKIHASAYEKLTDYCKRHQDSLMNVATQAIEYALSNEGE